MRRTQWVAALAALCLVHSPALADSDDDSGQKPGFGRRGFYLGANFAYGFGDFYESILEDEFPVSVSVKDALGLNARVGYRLLPFLALEAHYEWMNDFELKVAGLSTADQTTHTVTGNLKLLLPLWRVQPYLLLGAGGQYYEIEDKLTGLFSQKAWVFAARPAVGLDLYLTRHFVLNVEGAGVIALSDLSATLASVETLPYVSLSAGVQWRF